MPRSIVDITGNRYGSLVVLEQRENIGQKTAWLCQCDCGNQKIIRGDSLKSGATRSCGCFKEDDVARAKRYNTYSETEKYMVGCTNKGDLFFFDKDDYDLISKYTWFKHDTGYFRANTKSKQISMHRLVMGCYRDDNELEVDHINHNISDNRKVNLRLVTNAQNQMNKQKSTRNTSGAKGVSWSKSKKCWFAQIGLNGKLIFIGSYADFDSACEARKEKEKELYKEYNYDPSTWDCV